MLLAGASVKCVPDVSSSEADDSDDVAPPADPVSGAVTDAVPVKPVVVGDAAPGEPVVVDEVSEMSSDEVSSETSSPVVDGRLTRRTA